MTSRFVLGAGALRVGHARLALIAWMAARHGGTRFLLRHNHAATDDLAWLGLDWIEAPSQVARHAAAADRLRDAGRLYPCFETEEELSYKQERRARRGEALVYDRAMLRLTDAQRVAAEAGGKRPYWRFRLSDGDITWNDRANHDPSCNDPTGRRTVALQKLSDPILIQSNGTVGAALAGVVDDLADGVTLLVRDADQVSRSAIYLDVVAALGGRAPVLAHLPPLPDDLAGTTVRRLRQDGVLATALATLLAWPEAPAPRPLAELVAGFDWQRPGQVDIARLRTLNRAGLAATPFDVVADRLPADATTAFWEVVRNGIDLIGEAQMWWNIIGEGFVPPVMDAAVARRARATMPPEPWNAATWSAWAAAFGDAGMLRVVLTGEETGPDMAAVLPLIGAHGAAARLTG